MANHWLDKTEYPFTSRYFTINGQKLHFIDEGEGETVLFVHGTPSWSFDYRHIIKNLKKNYRCIAIDHIGFGLSDKPEHYDYSTLNHSKTLEKFVLENRFDNLTLVVHDFGGVIGLHFAMQYPEKIKRLVIMNSWLWSSESDPDYVQVKNILKSPFLPHLYRYLNFSARFVMPSSFGENKMSKQIRHQYTKPFANKTQRNGTIAFAMSLLHDQDWFEQLWNQRHTLSSKPVLFIWGMKDPVIKPQHLGKFQLGFPNSTTVRLETSGHFPQEEQPEAVTNAILTFLEETK